MLLRSSSTPLLASLLPPLSHSEPLPESSETRDSPVTPEVAKSVSFSSCSSNCPSWTSQSACGNDSFSRQVEEDARDLDVEIILWPRMRKVQSETDLQRLSLGSATAARAAANSLLCHDKLDPGPDALVNTRKSFSRPVKSRRRSLGSIPSLYLGSSGLGSQDLILEEEVQTPGSLDLTEGVGRRNTCEEIGNPPSYMNDTFSTTSFQHPTTGRALRVKDQIDLKERELCVATPTNERERGSFSRREVEEEARWVSSPTQTVNGGSYSRTIISGSNGISTLNDSRDYRQQHGSDDKRGNYFRSGGGLEVGNYNGSGIGGGGGGGKLRNTSTGDGPGADADYTDLYYSKMLAENPGHPLLLRNYAQFLAETKRNYAKADEYYQRAILANASDGELLAQYANMIWNIHRDYERAASYFERAVQAAPDDSYVMAAYASFLWNSEEEEEEGSATPLPTVPSLVSAGLA